MRLINLPTLLIASLCLVSQAAPLRSAPVRADGAAGQLVAEGVVEALRHSVLASQVAGVVSQLPVKAGDTVQAGQLLVRIDARAAEQNAAASGAQAEAARAALEVAQKDYERQKQLFHKQFISAAAMDRAESQFKAARAQAQAQLAAAGAARTQSGFYTLSAPYAGVIADVPANLGEMALPGRTLLTLYDPSALRVSISLPQSSLAKLDRAAPVRIEFPALPAAQRWQTASAVTVLPTADALTQTVQLRLALPSSAQLSPGLFARAWLSSSASGGTRLYVPSSALFRRGEMQLVYVLDAQGKPQLRQVKPGPSLGAESEILAGLRQGERVALDPLAAAQVR